MPAQGQKYDWMMRNVYAARIYWTSFKQNTIYTKSYVLFDYKHKLNMYGLQVFKLSLVMGEQAPIFG